MPPTVTGVVLGLIWFGGITIGQVILFRLYTIRDRFTVIVRLLAVALVGEIVSATVFGPATGAPGWALPSVCGVTTIACCWVLYMPFYYVIANSMSVQTLIELKRSGRCAVPLAHLEAKFGSATMLRERLETMVSYGNAARRGDAFEPTRKGRMTARLFAAVKVLWRLGPGG